VGGVAAARRLMGEPRFFASFCIVCTFINSLPFSSLVWYARTPLTAAVLQRPQQRAF
jgi:hypothetical protein